MNRIILIGNGFDLAHGLKTSYVHFIDWFWEEELKKIKNNLGTGVPYQDDYISMKYKFRNWLPCPEKTSYQELLSNLENNHAENVMSYKNKFLEIITKKTDLQNWVDIEEEYYEQLKTHMIRNEIEKIKKLNSDLKQIKDELEKYLKQEYRTRFKPTDIQNKRSYYNLLRIIDSEFEKKDFTTEIASGKPRNILFINFNYTSIENLYRSPNLGFDADCIHIHGELYDDQNPIIFGYGDEIDDDYKMLEKKSVGKNFILENMKSVNYSQANNYSRILRFINSDLYQIFILGHSCGNSDRTLLNKLFEHENCVSIKPYCYIDKDGKSDYIDKYINISRHFNDKHLLRERVVNASDCDLMPQF